MKIKCLIVDDDPLAIKILKNHLKRFKDYEIVTSCNNAIDALGVLRKKQIDLIFLDINMPKLNGIDFIKKLNEFPFIIITSACAEYAVECFELSVTDYLLKPIYLQRLIKSLNKVSKLMYLQNSFTERIFSKKKSELNINKYFFVNINKKLIKIYFKDILYIEGLKDYVSIKTIHKSYITHHNLLSITKLLPGKEFIRIHRSYIISLNKVGAIDGNRVQINNKMIPIGRKYVQETKIQILNGIVVG